MTDTDPFYSINDVSRLIGVPYWRIAYAHRIGNVPEPMRVRNARMYRPEEVEHLRCYFSSPARDPVKQ